MKKNMNTTAIANELKGGSAFFRSNKPTVPLSPTPVESDVSPQEQDRATTQQEVDTVIPRYRDTTVSRSGVVSIEEKTRRAVKQLGKEAATYRFTTDEKRALSDIVYAYKQRGIRTTENEITRISINYLLEEHHRVGDKSILAKIIALLND